MSQQAAEKLSPALAAEGCFSPASPENSSFSAASQTPDSSASSRVSASVIGGRQVRPWHTMAHTSAPAGTGTCKRVSARASGTPPLTNRCRAIRTTVLFTANRALAVASSRRLPAPNPRRSPVPGPPAAVPAPDRSCLRTSPKCSTMPAKHAQRIFGYLAILPPPAERFQPQQRRSSSRISRRASANPAAACDAPPRAPSWIAPSLLRRRIEECARSLS